MARSSEADASMVELDREAKRLATIRDTDGRYVSRYPGITRPKLDPNFDRKGFVAALQKNIKPAAWATWSLTAKRLGITLEQAVHGFEQLCWWNLSRKTCTLEGRGRLEGVIIRTPDGSWVVDAIRWMPKADA